MRILTTVMKESYTNFLYPFSLYVLSLVFHGEESPIASVKAVDGLGLRQSQMSSEWILKLQRD